MTTKVGVEMPPQTTPESLEEEVRQEIESRIEKAAENSGRSANETADLLTKDEWLSGWCPAVPFQGSLEPICDVFEEIQRLIKEEDLDFEAALEQAFEDKEV